MHSLRVEQIFGSYFDGFLLQLGCERSVGLTDMSISSFRFLVLEIYSTKVF